MNAKLLRIIRNSCLFLLLIQLFNFCSDDDIKPEKEDDTLTAIFDQIWTDFDEIYPYFVHKNINWDSIYTVYYSQIDENTTEVVLSELIGQMTMELKDVHVQFKSPYHFYHYSRTSSYPLNPPDYAIDYLENVVINNNYVTFANVKNTNYAYLRIKNLSGNISDYETAIEKLADISIKDGLIVDIRSNPGGNEAIGWEFAGVLSNENRLYRYSRYRNGPNWDDFGRWNPMSFESKTANAFNKKIILLTNRSVVSSAELYTLMMNTLPNVITVGDTTYGGSANPREYNYNQNWYCRISRWQAVTVNYDFIEDRGIAPDYCVIMTAQNIIEEKDVILEKAIALLNE